ncbi:P63C domain-containing protein [Novosphingobium sp.]|uniref:P63C domain-containing protein n=1 Tax=Novosphingobium sp. TaxID=1874826 RepID=UPI00260FC392|nr:P63C domain-containing protein [Novosphingobium sp.]
MASKLVGRAKGGAARAAALTKEELSESGRKAAAARWSLPRVEHEGFLELPGIVPMNVANLDDGRRVVTAKALLEALGRPWKGAYQRTGLPSFLDAKNLEPFITEDVRKVLDSVDYLGKRGQKITGYLAELIPEVCRVYLRASDAGVIVNKRQAEVAELARQLYHGLATIGIFQLLDDATGYSKIRTHNELQVILRAYIAPELLPRHRRFSDEFYEELHRVYGWTYKPGNNARNSYIGKLTKSLIYNQLPKGVAEELDRLNPYEADRKGRKELIHRLLTKEIGVPHLEKQIVAVSTLLRLADDGDRDGFLKNFAKLFPIREGLFSLPQPEPGTDD